MTFLIDLMITLIGYVILAFSYLGLGWASSRILRIDFPVKEKLFFLIWLGWAVTLFLLQIINLFIPINIFSNAPFLILGTIFVIVFLKNESWKEGASNASWVYPVLLAITTVWIAVLSMLSPRNNDSGLYHFNSIRWLNEYPIVLGLGNLHYRLAFNQSFFAYVAYLNLYPLFNHGYNLAISFLLLLLFAECLLFLSRLLIAKDLTENSRLISIIAVFFIPPLIYLTWNSNIPSPEPDIASVILQILIFIHFIQSGAGNTSTKNDDSRIMFLLILSATAITVKLSNLFFVLSVCAILLIIKQKSLRLSKKQAFLRLGKLLALPALIIFIWSLRGILLSGCPLYPSTFGCIKVDWAVSLDAVKNAANVVYSWARQPGKSPDQVLNSWAWFGPWLQGILTGYRVAIIYPIVISFIGAMISFLTYIFLPPIKTNKFFFLVPIPILISLLFWFGLAPDPRFANALFWMLPVSMIIIIIVKILELSPRIRIGMIAVMFLMINANIALFFVQNPRTFPNIPINGFRQIPSIKLTKNTTLYGINIWTPSKGNRCWDSKIPCTPYFDETLNFKNNTVFPEFTTGKQDTRLTPYPLRRWKARHKVE